MFIIYNTHIIEKLLHLIDPIQVLLYGDITYSNLDRDEEGHALGYHVALRHYD